MFLHGREEIGISGNEDTFRNRYDGFLMQHQITTVFKIFVCWSAQDICTGGAKESIYLRATDTRGKGDRLAVSVVIHKTRDVKKRFGQNGIDAEELWSASFTGSHEW